MPRWPELRSVLVGQATLILGEAAILLIIERRLLLGITLLIVAHVWGWRQTVWRKRDICALIRTLKQIRDEQTAIATQAENATEGENS